MVKLQWLRINKFRRVRPGTLLTFNLGYNVLLGQNGTGKTTLLSLVSAVVSSNFSDFINEEFELEYELASDKTKMRFLLKNDRQPLTRENNIRLGFAELDRFFTNPDSGFLDEAESEGLALSLRIQVHPSSRLTPNATFTFGNGKSVGMVVLDVMPSREVSFEKRHASPNRIFVADDLLKGIATWFGYKESHGGVMFGVYTDLLDEVFKLHPFLYGYRFDESLGYFSTLSGGDIEVTLIEKRDWWRIRNARLPRSISDKLMEIVRREFGKSRYAIAGSQVPFLERLAGTLGFSSAELVFEFEKISEDGRMEFLKSGSQRFFFTHEGGWRISDKHLSYGQKRMLALMYYLECTRDIAIVDELVNGLHHNWIQACVEELGQRQVFLTSQNPLLLDYLTFDSPEEVRSRFVLCSWERDTKQMIWENMSQDAAEDFFASYKVGFQQVGELLQSKGLW